MTTHPFLATVTILTFNGERYLREILEAVTAQELDGAFDILVIDSGSTDGTLAIVRDFPEVRLHRIPNEEFGHGVTRNLAARLSRGEFTAYLTHDATPQGPHWLASLLKPMRDDARVGGVVGRQIPRATCIPLVKYEIDGVFAGQGSALGTTAYEAAASDDEGTLRHKGFYSDVNSAARTELLCGDVPYRPVDYAEDQLFGRDLLAKGWRKAYAGTAAVVHSNDLTYAEYGMRIFDETLGLRRVGFESDPISRRFAWSRVVRSSLADTLRIARDPSFGRKATLRWLVVNPWYQARKWSHIRKALAAPISGLHGAEKTSLEGHRRSTAKAPDDRSDA